MGDAEQPGDGDQCRLGEAGVADHGEAAAGRYRRGLHQDRDHRHHDRLLQEAAGHGRPGQLHRGEPGQRDRPDQRRSENPGHPAQEAEGAMGQGQGHADEGGRAAGAGGQRLGLPGR